MKRRQSANSAYAPAAFTLGACMLASTSLSAQSVSFEGVITTAAGTGQTGYTGDNGLANSATLHMPYDVAVDGSGNFYIADSANNVIRRVTAATGKIATVAGGGTGCTGQTDTYGDGCPATSAILNSPFGVAVDGAGNLYIADTNDNLVRMVSAATNVMTTVAGDGTAGYNKDGITATTAELDNPNGVAVDSNGNLYIADTANQRIREVTGGKISTIAGTGTGGYNNDGIAATGAEVNAPAEVKVDAFGNVFIADTGNNRVREIVQSTGKIETIAGTSSNGYNGDGIAANTAELNGPVGVAVDTSGDVFISDTQNARVREVSAATGMILTVAGNGTPGFSGDGGGATQGQISLPYGLSADTRGNVFVADDGNQRIREVQVGRVDFGPIGAGSTSSTLTVEFSFSGTVNVGKVAVLTSGAAGHDFASASGTNCAVTSYSTEEVCVVNVTFTPQGAGVRLGAVVLYDTETPANTLISVPLSGYGFGPTIGMGGIVTTIAGGAPENCAGEIDPQGDGCPVLQVYLDPNDFAFDGAGNLFISDGATEFIRKVDATTGIISDVAGVNPSYGNCAASTDAAGDGCPADSVYVGDPLGVGLDGAGNVIISTGQYAMRRVDAQTGIITRYASGGSGCAQQTDGFGDGCPALDGSIPSPGPLTFDAYSNLYIPSDTGVGAVRKIDPATGIVTDAAGQIDGGIGCAAQTDRFGDGCVATLAGLDLVSGVAFDAAGNMYIADQQDELVQEVSAQSGIITAFAGTGVQGYNGDGIPPTTAKLNIPMSVAVDLAGNVYIGTSDRIRMVSAATGLISTIAGDGTGCAAQTDTIGDGCPPADIKVSNPRSMKFDGYGNLYFADTGNNRLRRIGLGSSPSLTFPTTNVSAVSAAQDVVIQNFGNAQLDITQIGISPNFSLGGADTTCLTSGQILAAGASCVLGIEFAPQTTGSLMGNVTITATGAFGASAIALSGVAQSTTPAPTPTFAPPPGTYATAQKVTITDSASGAAIYYTTNGSTPTTGSTSYTGPITVSASETLQAIAVASGFLQSSVGTAAYVIETPAATPVIAPKGGAFAAAVFVKITDATAGASIYYTTNGTAPSTSSKKYTAPFTVSSDETVKAVATAPGFTPSAIASASFTVKSATPVFSVKSGKYAKAQLVKITDTTPGAAIHYTVNGTTPTATSKKYTGAITVSADETIKAIAVAKNYSNSAVAEAAYVIETAPPTISPDGGTFTKAQTVTLKDATPDAVIYYTINGKTPTAKSTKYTKAFAVSAKTTVKAIAIAPEHAASPVASATFTIN